MHFAVCTPEFWLRGPLRACNFPSNGMLSRRRFVPRLRAGQPAGSDDVVSRGVAFDRATAYVRPGTTFGFDVTSRRVTFNWTTTYMWRLAFDSAEPGAIRLLSLVSTTLRFSVP